MLQNAERMSGRTKKTATSHSLKSQRMFSAGNHRLQNQKNKNKKTTTMISATTTTMSDELRRKVYHNALPWCLNNYTESNGYNLIEFDNPKGCEKGGCKNYTRFGFLFDNLLDPKRWAGGPKNGLSWCAMFVVVSAGTFDFSAKERSCANLIEADKNAKFDLQQRFVASLDKVLGLRSNSTIYTEKQRQFSYLAGVPQLKKFCNISPIKHDKAKLCDLIIFGESAHVGFVESVTANTITTLEGNTSSKTATANGGQCCRKTYIINNNNSLSQIIGNKTLNSWQKFQIYALSNLQPLKTSLP